MFRDHLSNSMWKFAYGTLALVAVGGYFYIEGGKDYDTDTIIVERGDILRSAQFSGTIVPAEHINIGFEREGKVVDIHVDIGDIVSAGSLIASLDDQEMSLRLLRLRSELETAKSLLKTLENSFGAGALESQTTRVSAAAVTLAESQKHVIETMKDIFTSAHNIISHKVDQFISNSNKENPSLTFTTDKLSRIDLEKSRLNMEMMLSAWESEINGLTFTTNLKPIFNNARTRLSELGRLLSNAEIALDGAVTGSEFIKKDITGWMRAIDAAQTKLDVDILHLNKEEEKFDNSISNLAQAEGVLGLIRSGITENDIETQRTIVQQKKEEIYFYESEMSKSNIFSPVSGKILERSIDTDEFAVAGGKYFSIIPDATFEITSEVTELDTKGITTNIRGLATFGVYGPREEFDVVVTDVDKTHKIIGDVPTQKVTLQFLNDDHRIKDGMTANVVLSTGFKEDVLIVPPHALKRVGGRVIARVYRGGILQDVEVVTGIYGNDGMVEIAAGLVGGEIILESIF